MVVAFDFLESLWSPEMYLGPNAIIIYLDKISQINFHFGTIKSSFALIEDNFFVHCSHFVKGIVLV